MLHDMCHRSQISQKVFGICIISADRFQCDVLFHRFSCILQSYAFMMQSFMVLKQHLFVLCLWQFQYEGNPVNVITVELCSYGNF